jgi:hypothetical protein
MYDMHVHIQSTCSARDSDLAHRMHDGTTRTIFLERITMTYANKTMHACTLESFTRTTSNVVPLYNHIHAL